jgi:predicted Holliday junction resolvase-like endonuclease
VNTGLIGEQLAPFLNDWPYDLKKFRFIGYPIDGMQITDDGLIIIEIKTGNSCLSKQQRKIRNLIKEGKVYFETFRINEKGCKLTRCDNASKKNEQL